MCGVVCDPWSQASYQVFAEIILVSCQPQHKHTNTSLLGLSCLMTHIDGTLSDGTYAVPRITAFSWQDLPALKGST